MESALKLSKDVEEICVDDVKLLSYAQKIHNNQKVAKIPVHIPDGARQTTLTPLQYHILNWGLFLGQLRGAPPTEMQIDLKKLMFSRVVVDVDYKGDNMNINSTDAQMTLISSLSEIIKRDKNDFVVTKRRESSTNFHVVSSSQVDIVSFWSIISELSQIVLPTGFVVDRPTCWTVSTGRQHKILNKWDSMTWEDVKRISVVDVWRSDLNTVLKLEPEEEDSIGSLVDETGVIISWLHRGPWSRFEDVFFRYSTHSLVSDTYIHPLKLIREYLPTVLIVKPKTIEEDDDTGHSLEFFESVYTSTIKYVHPPKDFVPLCENKKVSVDYDSIAASMAQLPKTGSAHLTPREVHLRFLKTQKFITTDSIKLVEASAAKNANIAYKWEEYIYLILKYINDGDYIVAVIRAYYHYCCNNSIVPVVDSQFTTSLVNLKSNEEMFYQDKSVQAIIKHILCLMLDNCCVGSVLSLLIRSHLFVGARQLESAVLLIHSLDVSPVAKRMSIEYISNKCADHTTAISVKMQQVFFFNDMLYFLCEIYNMTVKNALEKFTSLKLFPALQKDNDGEDDEAPHPPPKKRQRKKEKYSLEMDIFARYIVFMYQLGSTFYVFQKNAYGRLSPADELDTSYATGRADHEEPSHDMYWYRREIGIFFSISSHFEYNAPSLFSPINIRTYPPLVSHGDSIFRTDDEELKSLMLDTFLKARHFLDFCGYNQLAFVLLSPITPTASPTTPYETVQIILVDLNIKGPFPDFKSHIHKFEQLHLAMSHLYAVVCSISSHCKVDIENPASFIELCGADCVMDEEALNVRETGSEISAFEQIGGTFTGDETIFIKLLRLAVGKPDTVATSNRSNDTDIVYLDVAHITTETTDSIKIYVATRFFDGVFNGKKIDFTSLPDSTVNFILLLLSWFVRFNTQHVLSPTAFFTFMDSVRGVVYNELTELVTLFIGRPMVHRDTKNLQAHLKAFCQNTVVTIDSKFNALIPPGFSLGVSKLDHKYADDIYFGIAGLIVFGQFVYDNTLDIHRFLVRFAHRGNVDRFVFALLNRTGTGKNFMIEYIIDLLFPTQYMQKYANTHFQNNEKEAGNILTDSMNCNLLVWFDEVESLPPSCKTFVGFGVLSEREFHSKAYVNKRINSHVIISANSDPIGKDSATNNRMRPIDRKMQYVELIENINISRTDGVADTTLSKINEYLGVQLLLSRLPSGGETRVDDVGLFLTIWNSIQLFLNTFSSPVSRKISKKMQQRMEKYLYTAEPALYLLKNNLIRCTPSQSMSLLDFENRVVALFGQYKNIIGGGFVVSDAVLDLKDRLSNYIQGNRIHVDI